MTSHLPPRRTPLTCRPDGDIPVADLPDPLPRPAARHPARSCAQPLDRASRGRPRGDPAVGPASGGGRDAGRVAASSTHDARDTRSEEHTSELQSLMRISYAVFCLKKKTTKKISRKCDTGNARNTHYYNTYKT